MKKNLLYIVLGACIGFMFTSCQSYNAPTTNYPDSIIGYWESASKNQDKWYGLDISDASNAAFITYYSQDDPTEQTMSITYDATTGKGQLSGERKITLQASSDTTLELTWAEGTVVFHRGIRPEPTVNIIGYWKSNRINGVGLDILVYPNKTDVTVIYSDRMGDFVEIIGTMGTLDSFDPATGNGSITSINYTGKFNIDVAAIAPSLTLTDSEDPYVLTKQPKATNVPQSLKGTWKSSIPGILSVNIEVAADNTCKIDYSVINPKTKEQETGIANGITYYCPAAGMGAVIPTDMTNLPELLSALLNEETCALFTAISDTQISVPLPMKIMEIENLILTKQ